ncbi:ImcF-related family protein [Amantichitinum ursilacus]|uniref:Intracellular multiplication and macrophage-killing n=1 Tax=Amantichitinum ursilacus TaxID=857265 RepID=A0A0N0XKR5_9NEIS|nr:ImcF-related family protein [Amantichitinum ursilacus]KPC52610.1 Intracellular multiplication and macrophage-killing [Amantichitinum ursilacus]
MVLLITLVLLVGICILGVLLYVFLWPLLINWLPAAQDYGVWMVVGAAATVVVVGLAVWFLTKRSQRRVIAHALKTAHAAAPKPDGKTGVATDGGPQNPRSTDPVADLRKYLKGHYSWRQRRSKPWFWVTGSGAQVSAHFPYLLEQQWLDTPQAVLLWVGEGALEPGGGWGQSRGKWRRPADGIILVSAADAPHGQMLSNLAARSGYALPVQLLLSPAIAGARDEPAAPILVQLPVSTLRDADQTGQAFRHLIDPLAHIGLAAIVKQRRRYFDAALSRFLDRNSKSLGEWLSQLAHNLQRQQRLAGIWFAPQLKLVAPRNRLGAVDAATLHQLAQTSANALAFPKPILQSFRRQRKPKLRFTAFDACCTALAICVALWGCGMAESYRQNRALADQINADLAALQAAPNLQTAFPSLLALQDQIALLEARIEHGAPWLSRFGLNHDRDLLAVTWQPYGAAAHKWLLRPMQTQLAAQLQTLDALPLDGRDTSTEHALEGAGQQGYDTLKTWLMLSQAKHADAGFLAPRLLQTGKVVWPTLSVDGLDRITKFYAAHLTAHPEWQLPGDQQTLFAARQTLSGLITLKQADDTLYQQLLADTKARYPDPTMGSLIGGRDARGLWSVKGRLPGTFTRQAYEGYVRDAIKQRVGQAATRGDWVLGQQLDQEAIKPADLEAALNKRYFADFGYAWQSFLNRLDWMPEANLSGTSEQLRVYADAQQSPLAALMKTIVWQAQTGAQQTSLADTLVAKAQNVFKGKQPPADAGTSAMQRPAAPLAETFGPLLRLVGSTEESSAGGAMADNGLSLQRYLDRVSATRLKLDQVNAAADPDAFARQQAQNLFQGRANDLLDARSYAELVAASLGSGYAAMGQNLFLRPLDQSWRTLMQPASASLKSLWQSSVYLPFNSAFSGRFPFNDTEHEASLPELARFLAPQGVLAQFAQTQLGGILEQQGDQWVPNPLYTQALRFDPDFLNALNRLSRLSSHLYAEGQSRYRFDLLAMGHPQLTDSKLTIDGQVLDYFNQKQKWAHFNWPGEPESAGSSLTWTALQTGLQQKDDFNSTWGFVRLLSKARIEPIDKASYRIEWTLDDNLRLRYALRTQVGAGPLELLQLKGFKLPQRVFITGREPAPASASRPAKTPMVSKS